MKDPFYNRIYALDNNQFIDLLQHYINTFALFDEAFDNNILKNYFDAPNTATPENRQAILTALSQLLEALSKGELVKENETDEYYSFLTFLNTQIQFKDYPALVTQSEEVLGRFTEEHKQNILNHFAALIYRYRTILFSDLERIIENLPSYDKNQARTLNDLKPGELEHLYTKFIAPKSHETQTNIINSIYNRLPGHITNNEPINADEREGCKDKKRIISTYFKALKDEYNLLAWAHPNQVRDAIFAVINFLDGKKSKDLTPSEIVILSDAVLQNINLLINRLSMGPQNDGSLVTHNERPGYSFLPMTQNPNLKKNTIYWKIENNILQYKVKTSSEEINDQITPEDLGLPDGTLLTKNHLPQILKITSGRGHTQHPISLTFEDQSQLRKTLLSLGLPEIMAAPKKNEELAAYKEQLQCCFWPLVTHHQNYANQQEADAVTKINNVFIANSGTVINSGNSIVIGHPLKERADLYPNAIKDIKEISQKFREGYLADEIFQSQLNAVIETFSLNFCPPANYKDIEDKEYKTIHKSATEICNALSAVVSILTGAQLLIETGNLQHAIVLLGGFLNDLKGNSIGLVYNDENEPTLFVDYIAINGEGAQVAHTKTDLNPKDTLKALSSCSGFSDLQYLDPTLPPVQDEYIQQTPLEILNKALITNLEKQFNQLSIFQRVIREKELEDQNNNIYGI